VEIYCDSGDCDAREVEVIVVDDGTVATRNRSDVRIMAHFAPDVDRPEWVGVGPGQDWAAGTPPYLRRDHGTAANSAVCLFCGEQTCTLSRNDVAAANCRLRSHCTNSKCRVREAEVLLTRDGLLWASRRPVVEALRSLFPTRANQLAADLPEGELPIFPVSDSFEPAEGVDPLTMRLSGPVPW
jgi:hypothetical protein